MVRTLTHRLLTAAAGLVFATTGGLTGMEAHPLSVHGPHAHDVMAAAPATESHHSTATDGASHHPSGHSHHGSSEECTCVGPCQGGGTPSLPDPSAAGTVAFASDHTTVVPIVAIEVREHPAPYLLPLPNAPPERV